jgi:hypothetical protein
VLRPSGGGGTRGEEREERDGRVRGAEERRSEESGACSRTASERHLRRQCAQARETRAVRRAEQPLVVGLRLHGDARGLYILPPVPYRVPVPC